MAQLIKTESGLEDALKRWLREQPGCWFFKTVGGPYQQPGIPDIIICWHGYFVAIELKTPGRLQKAQGVYTPKSDTEILQLRVIEAIRAAGGYGGVFDSLVKIIEYLENISLQDSTNF